MRPSEDEPPRARKSVKVVISSDEYDVEDAPEESDETVQESAVPRKSVGAYNFGL